MKKDNDTFSEADRKYMQLALSASENGMYTTTPNPRVGCVLVKENKVLSVGWHQRAGDNHAEINCFNQIKKEDLIDATAYVTLEPCCHHGLTLPCVDSIVENRLKRVVISSLDPNPLVSGKGREKLRANNIVVHTGLMANEALMINCGFFKRMMCSKPWIRIKMAFSLDGRTALSSGESKWITNEECRQDVHHWRARSCGVITGIGTILADNPSMNVRYKETTRQPTLIILDSKLRIPLSSNCLGVPNRKIIIAHSSTNKAKENDLHENNISTVLCPKKNGLVDMTFLLSYLGEKEEMNEVIVEAGTKVSTSLHQEEYDELICYVGGKILGHQAQPMLHLSLEKLHEAQQLDLINTKVMKNDIRLIYHHPNNALHKWHEKYQNLTT
ncbi:MULTISPECIES: bifunctional diaminohydroxyphosphoribosylaminopyrimidine deaminase/5-amino-6-(5-phosphoribosylamino)uracil reductase RibD [Candidatus Ichthyocystis]|uniref:Riboflavin biosynthesis protein RibD n=1 Tax=Candidatus Ichthyocystis hellenicum TaxID=1561003 RepID=A0A0S4M2D3_9BURK|nr:MULTISPECIES: bifunctional diaminohydroxyphosphoribosylaminopyrimidine deaminase/5-amino-6-(5-phosphoribosylamino)uracil reductase RibD [Ichthyocystis]CUT17042.1 Riboflavin biosynthesis protein [Candidatus Ichthyocystis hellenicum]